MIYYETYGNKFNPIIFLLHGENYVYTFAKQYELRKNYFLVIPHLPGFGKSALTEFKADTAVKKIAELAEFFGRPVTLVGFSLGAQLCLPLLCKHEKLFNGAVMISPWLIKTPESIMKAMNHISSSDSIVRNPITVNMTAVTLGLNGEEKRLHTEYCRNYNINSLAAAIDNGIVLDDYQEFADVKVPLAALCGLKEDIETRKSVRALAKLNPSCTYDMWDNAAHNLPYKCSARLNKFIEEFVDKLK